MRALGLARGGLRPVARLYAPAGAMAHNDSGLGAEKIPARNEPGF